MIFFDSTTQLLPYRAVGCERTVDQGLTTGLMGVRKSPTQPERGSYNPVADFWMRRVCAWCGCELPPKPCDAREHGTTTHTICEPCCKKLLEVER